MKSRKTLIITALLCACMAGVTLAASRVMVLSEKSAQRDVATVDVAKPVHIEVYGGLPVSSTIVVYRLSGAGAYTNTIASVTTESDGTANAAIALTNTAYVLRGDSLYYGGVSTSGVVRLILED